MINLKRGTEEDVDSLIESMLRLIEYLILCHENRYMNQNPAFKRDIFKSFSAEDLNKILKNMEDSNISINGWHHNQNYGRYHHFSFVRS